MPHESIKRLPLYSIAAGGIVAVTLMADALTAFDVSPVGLGAIALLPLAAALVDAIRLGLKASDRSGAGQGGAESPSGATVTELQQFLDERAESLARRERELSKRALSLQQWLQFPDAIDFQRSADPPPPTSPPDRLPGGGPKADGLPIDPMAIHDQQLYALIEKKTHELFDNIKDDAYRIDRDGKKSFDVQRIRDETFALVSDVVAIYRPGEESPLLMTNVEATSRAIGRASLRLLVAVESLPGDLAGYSFQSIYNVVRQAVKTFGMYKAAKPYLDVASSIWLAGRIVSSTNPITLVAWWAASRATTYGASKLGEHVVNQQAVGLIRQLVEIVSIEVASIYSPLVRYRDVHWIYGVELVHLASELPITDAARGAAMRQLAALNLRDEYGRVSLMRQLACGTSSRPANYRPADSLSAEDRSLIAARLEEFLQAHVISDPDSRVDAAAIDRWQESASDRLDIRLNSADANLSAEDETERAIWALASFGLQHFDEESEEIVEQLHLTKTWNTADSETRLGWIRELKANPPFLYHPPALYPGGEACKRFLDDLVTMAGNQPGKPIGFAEQSVEDKGHYDLPPWSGEQAIRMTGYSLRADVNQLMTKYYATECDRLFDSERHCQLTPDQIRGIAFLIDQHPSEQSARCAYADAALRGHETPVCVLRLDSTLYCVSARRRPSDDTVTLTVHLKCPLREAEIEKVSGYVRSDCRITFGGRQVTVPGSTLRGYDSYFSGLLTA